MSQIRYFLEYIFFVGASSNDMTFLGDHPKLIRNHAFTTIARVFNKRAHVH